MNGVIKCISFTMEPIQTHKIHNKSLRHIKLFPYQNNKNKRHVKEALCFLLFKTTEYFWLVISTICCNSMTPISPKANNKLHFLSSNTVKLGKEPPTIKKTHHRRREWK